MKKLSKAMYGKSMMKKGGMKKMADGGGVGTSQASGGRGSNSNMTPNSSRGSINSPDTVYAPGKKKVGGSTTKMMKGGAAKPKAMYGTAMKPGMMKKGGAKKMK